MAGGLGTRLFVAGDVITAADVNGYLMNQTIMRFATTADRDTAFGNGIAIGQTVGGVAGDGKPLLQEGMFAYIDFNNDVTYFNGSIWVSAPTFVLEDGAVTSAKIADGAIMNVDINASAGIVDTKLATIATAGKVSNSATTATNANTPSTIVARDSSGNFSAGSATLTVANVTTVIEGANIVSASATGTVDIDFSTNPTVYYTGNASADWTLNVRGTSSVSLNDTLSTGQIATVTFLATIGSTQRRPTVFQVDGSAVTPKWMGGTAPATGNASSIDAYTLAIIKTGNAAFTVLASQTKFA